MLLNRFGLAALAAGVLVLTAAPAGAHTHVQKMSIEENAKLAASPPDFTVEFEAKTTLANISLMEATGKNVPLAYKPPHDKATSFKIPLPKLAAGGYMLMWKTIGADGHAVSGMVNFTITG